MAIQTKANAQVELDKWYAARSALAAGKSFTMATESGTRVLTAVDLGEVNSHITRLERVVTNPGNRPHNHAVANFNHKTR